MMLGDTECDEATAYYLRTGKILPPPKRKQYEPGETEPGGLEDHEERLNYLEADYNAYFEEPRKQIWF